MDNDLYQLARIIHAEAEGEPFLGKVAVGAVIMNRLKDQGFPNTIKDIIFQPRQFSPVEDGRLDSIKIIGQDSIEAAKLAISGEDPTGGALFFYNPKKVSQTSWIRTRQIIYLIGEHVFCL